MLQHYENHLAEHYDWIFGGREKKLQENRELFTSLGLLPGPGKLALDLGAGTGFQSLVLAQEGYQVTAVDLSPSMLRSIQQANPAISCLVEDMLALDQMDLPPLDLICCMGDSLPHLPSQEKVQKLLVLARQQLKPGGKLVLSFRDQSQVLTGHDRFLPIRREDHRHFTCFLEDLGERLMVHDIIQERLADGSWDFRVSSYPKLRLEEPQVEAMLLAAGFAITTARLHQGLVVLVGEVG